MTSLDPFGINSGGPTQTAGTSIMPSFDPFGMANYHPISAGVMPGNQDEVGQAIAQLHTYNPDQQVHIIQQAIKAGMVDRNKGATAISQILGAANSPQPLSLNPWQRLVSGGADIAKGTAHSIGQLFTDMSKSNPETALYGGALSGKPVNPLAVATTYSRSHQKQLAGDALSALSFGAAPEGKAVLAGGTQGAKAALAMFGLGGAGGAGYTLQTNPNASIEDIAKNTLIGGAGGELPVVGSAIRRGVNVAADHVLASGAARGAIDAVAPYTSKIDAATRAALSKTGSAVRSGIEAIPGGKSLTSAVGHANDVFQQKAINSLHNVTKPILNSNALTAEEKAAIVGKLDDLRANLSRSSARASDIINTDPRIQQLREAVNAISPRNKEAQQAASDYVNAHEELNRINAGVAKASPERKAMFQDQIKQLESKYGKDKLQAARQAFINAQGIRRDLLQGIGATEEQFARWQEQNPNYVRLQREQNPEKMAPFNARGSGGNTNSLTQKINPFATSKAHDALATLIDSIHQAQHFRSQQEFAHGIIDAYKKANVPMRALNTTERAMTRKEIIAGLKQSKQLRDQLDTLAKFHRKAIRILNKDLKNLNERGMKKMFAKSEDIKNFMIKQSTGAKLAGSGSKVIGPIHNPEELLNQYINSPNGGFRDILNKLATKSDQLASLRNDLETISQALTHTKTQRAADFLKAQGLAAEPARGMPTITYYDNGVKNVYRVPKPVREAYDHLTAPQQTSLAKAARLVNNVFKYGTTQGNPVFAFKNIIRDQLSSALNSESVWHTHNPAIFMDALYNSITGKSGDFKRFVHEYEGTGNYVNVNRNPMKATAEARKVLNQGRKGMDKVTANSAPIVVADGAKVAARGFNELVNKLENLTRFQNYKGTYNFYLKKMNPLTGNRYTEEEAHQLAMRAARRNSTDFSASGDFGKVMNNYVPYFNAAIQGTRTLARSLRDRPATTTAKLAATTAPVLGLTYWNLSNPQNAAVYANVPEYQKQNNFVVVAGGHAFLIPMSQEFQAVSGVPRGIMESKFGANPNNFMAEAGNFIKALSPVNANSYAGVVTGMLPPQVRAAIELGANKNFYTGNQIIPDYIKAQNQNPTQQVYRDKNGNPQGVGPVEQGIANFLHTSPLDVQYYLKNALGTAVGQNGLDAIDTMGSGTSPGNGLGKSFQRSFVSSGGAVKIAFNNIYYPLSDSKNYKQKQINSLLYAGKITQAQRVANEWNNYVDQQFKPYYSQYGKYVDQSVPASESRVGSLKFDIRVSKAGRGYIK